MSIYIEQTAMIPAWDQDRLISWTGCPEYVEVFRTGCPDELEMNPEIHLEKLWEQFASPRQAYRESAQGPAPRTRPLLVWLRDPQNLKIRYAGKADFQGPLRIMETQGLTNPKSY
jgi:hypothetical protein